MNPVSQSDAINESPVVDRPGPFTTAWTNDLPL